MPTSKELVASILYSLSKMTGLDEETLAPFNDDLKQIDKDLDGVTDELTALGVLS